MKIEFFTQEEVFARYEGDPEPEYTGKRMVDILSRSTGNTEVRISLDDKIDKKFWSDLCGLMLKHNIIKEE